MNVDAYRAEIRSLHAGIEGVHDDYMIREVEAHNGTRLMENCLTDMEGIDAVLQNLRAAAEWTSSLVGEFDLNHQAVEDEDRKVGYNKERISELRHEASQLLMLSARPEAEELQAGLRDADGIAIEGKQLMEGASQVTSGMVQGAQLAMERLREAIAAIELLRPQAEGAIRALSLTGEKHQAVREPLGMAATKAQALVADL